jgi:hypothetical protein
MIRLKEGSEHYEEILLDFEFSNIGAQICEEK